MGNAELPAKLNSAEFEDAPKGKSEALTTVCEIFFLGGELLMLSFSQWMRCEKACLDGYANGEAVASTFRRYIRKYEAVDCFIIRYGAVSSFAI